MWACGMCWCMLRGMVWGPGGGELLWVGRSAACPPAVLRAPPRGGCCGTALAADDGLTVGSTWQPAAHSSNASSCNPPSIDDPPPATCNHPHTTPHHTTPHRHPRTPPVCCSGLMLSVDATPGPGDGPRGEKLLVMGFFGATTNPAKAQEYPIVYDPPSSPTVSGPHCTQKTAQRAAAPCTSCCFAQRSTATCSSAGSRRREAGRGAVHVRAWRRCGVQALCCDGLPARAALSVCAQPGAAPVPTPAILLLQTLLPPFRRCSCASPNWCTLAVPYWATSSTTAPPAPISTPWRAAPPGERPCRHHKGDPCACRALAQDCYCYCCSP